MNHNNCRITVPEIPVFFSTDDNYIPFLDVALSSLIENASRDYRYRIMILNTGLSAENMARILEREQAGFAIEFVDISDRLEGIMSHFRNVYHFSIVTYYRLFIASLFPRLDKIVYLDCDLVVTGDISKLYFTDMEDAIIAAAPEQYVRNTPAFRLYAEKALGVDPDGYVNAGVLVMDLRQFRRHRIEVNIGQCHISAVRITQNQFQIHLKFLRSLRFIVFSDIISSYRSGQRLRFLECISALYAKSATNPRYCRSSWH